jgi:hypothetical protein
MVELSGGPARHRHGGRIIKRDVRIKTARLHRWSSRIISGLPRAIAQPLARRSQLDHGCARPGHGGGHRCCPGASQPKDLSGPHQHYQCLGCFQPISTRYRRARVGELETIMVRATHQPFPTITHSAPARSTAGSLSRTTVWSCSMRLSRKPPGEPNARRLPPRSRSPYVSSSQLYKGNIAFTDVWKIGHENYRNVEPASQ